MKKNVLILLVLVGVLSGCEKPKPNPTPQDVIEDIGTGYLSVSDFCYYFNCRPAMCWHYEYDTIKVSGWINPEHTGGYRIFSLVDSVNDGQKVEIVVPAPDSTIEANFSSYRGKRLYVWGYVDIDYYGGPLLSGPDCGWEASLDLINIDSIALGKEVK